MIECPLCLSKVEKLKTNSHIIARCLIKDIKEDGKYLKVEKWAGIKRQQSEPKADIVCVNCEILFTESDSFADQFFRKRNFFKKKVNVPSQNGPIPCESHDKKAESKMAVFMASLALRGHLYNLATGEKNVLGPFYRTLADQFLSSNIDPDIFPLVIFLNEKYIGFHAFPEKIKFELLNCVQVVIFGYRIILLTDKRSDSSKVMHSRNAPDFLIPIVPKMNPNSKAILNFNE